MRQKPKNSKMAKCLDGVIELRAAVRWANGQPESDHDWMTAEEIVGAFRKAMEEWEQS